MECVDDGLVLVADEERGRKVPGTGAILKEFCVANDRRRMEGVCQARGVDLALCRYGRWAEHPDLDAAGPHGAFDGLKFGAGYRRVDVLVVGDLLVGPVLAALDEGSVFRPAGIGGKLGGA